MKVLAIIVLMLLPSIVVKADCGRLKAEDNYERLNQILECLDSRITELQKTITPRASSEMGKAVSEGAPVSDEEIEPNDHISQATPISLGATIRGRLKKDDKDYYQLTVPEGYDGNVRLICRQLSQSLAAFLRVQVYDSVEKQVAAGDGVGSPVSFTFSPETNSTYLIKVGWQVLSGDKLDYELVIRKEEG